MEFVVFWEGLVGAVVFWDGSVGVVTFLGRFSWSCLYSGMV